MANTYTQIFIHTIFAVKKRAIHIKPEWENDLYSYMTGIVKKNNHKLICINGMSDHVHMLISLNSSFPLANLIRDIKQFSTLWINKRDDVINKFSWQSGYGAFSYSKSQVPSVINYIKNQKLHHAKYNFIDEYKYFLTKFAVDYDEKYIFE